MSHSITRGSPAAFDQQKAAATGVLSAVSASHAWSSNCDGKLRAYDMYEMRDFGIRFDPRSAATGVSTA